MKKIALILVGAALLLGAGLTTDHDPVLQHTGGVKLTSKAINAIAYTGWLDTSQVDSVAFDIDYTWSKATAVTMACQTARLTSTANGAGFDIHVLDVTAGTATSTILTWSNAVSGNEKWTWTVANAPSNFLNCGFTATGGDGNDKASVYARGITP